MSVLVLDAGITHDGSLVQTDATALYCPCKGDLVGVEILPTRSARHLMGKIAKDVLDRVRAVPDTSILRQIWLSVSSAEGSPGTTLTVNGDEDSLHVDKTGGKAQGGKAPAHRAALKDAGLLFNT
jgi:hypothetical protein